MPTNPNTDPKTTAPKDDHPTAAARLTSWFDTRTGVNEILHESLDEPIPGGAKWAYVFGSGLLYLFISQVITGVFLALYYVPSADHAHTVVSYIVKEVTSGSFLRSIHAYGSSGIIILLVLHIGQTILYGSYKGRRELLWLSGCILLALMLGMAFTGYLLPWDEKAYFASAVGTNLIAEVPLIGPPLQRLVRGGNQMGTLTLSRFYVLHVFMLPAMLIGFIAAHVFFFRKAGAAGPIKEDPIAPKLSAVPFYPKQVLMDAVFSISIIIILAAIATFIPMDLGPAANPADTHFLPRPQWYYRPHFRRSNTSVAEPPSSASSCPPSSPSSSPRCRFSIAASKDAPGAARSSSAVSSPSSSSTSHSVSPATTTTTATPAWPLRCTSRTRTQLSS